MKTVAAGRAVLELGKRYITMRYIFIVIILTSIMLVPANADAKFNWTCQTAASGPYAYFQTDISLAFDGSGRPAISCSGSGIYALKLVYDRNRDGDFADPGEISIVSGGTGAQYHSLAFDGSGRPAISYWDGNDGDLKLAYDRGGDGHFSGDSITLDSAGNVGHHNSLAFDGNDRPAISYLDYTNENLKFAYDKNGDGDFTDPDEIIIVDGSGNGARYTSLAFDGNDRPAISYQDSSNADLKFAYDKNGDGDFADPGEIIILDSQYNTGFYTSLAFDRNDRPAISYQERDNFDLKFAYDKNGDGDFADPGEIIILDSQYNTGSYSSLAFDGSGRPAISYQDSSNDDLKFAYDTNGDGDFADSDEITIVDSAYIVGEHSSLAFDRNGWPAIAYWDVSNIEIKFCSTYSYPKAMPGIPLLLLDD
jgi:hypothetical protein